MRKTVVIALLLSRADELRAAGVAHISIFGSIARDEGGPSSDIDLIFGGPPDHPMTLFSMARAEVVLERILARGVDLNSQQGLDNAVNFKARIAPDLVPVF